MRDNQGKAEDRCSEFKVSPHNQLLRTQHSADANAAHMIAVVAKSRARKITQGRPTIGLGDLAASRLLTLHSFYSLDK